MLSSDATGEAGSDLKSVLFGTTIPGTTVDVVSAGRRVEEYGFDVVAIGEHIFFHAPTSSSLVLLSAVAATTSKIQLLTSVLVLPLYPAAVVAKMSATLDRLSHERFNLGIGIGGEYAPEFEACEADVSLRGRRTDQSLRFIRDLWSGSPVELPSGSGTKVTLDPAPSRPGGPPIWVAGRRSAAIRRAARSGDYWFPYLYSPEMLADSIVELNTHASEHRQLERAVLPAVHLFVCCDNDGNAARREIAATLGLGYAQDFDEPSRKYTVAGTPADCIERILEYVDAGARAVVLASACSPGRLDDNVRLLGEEVLPGLRERTTTAT